MWPSVMLAGKQTMSDNEKNAPMLLDDHPLQATAEEPGGQGLKVTARQNVSLH
jgi:hypothetical protein